MLKPDEQDDAAPAPRAAGAAVHPDVHPDLWRHWRRTKALAPLPGELLRRTIDVEVIVASAEAWAASRQSREADWDPSEHDGLVLAERTIG